MRSSVIVFPCGVTRPHGAFTRFIFPRGLVKHSLLPMDSCDRGWKDLYIAALFENNKARLAERIVIAQRAIGARRQQLFISGNDTQERQGPDTALSSLHVLATSLTITPRMAAKARAA